MSVKKKALFVFNNPVFGGGQGQVIRLREPLANHGWDLAAAAPKGSSTAARLRAGGVPVHELALHRLRAVLDPRTHGAFIAHLPSEVRALAALVRREQFDLVQAHGDIHLQAPLAARRERVPLVWQLYDTRTPQPLRRLTMPLVTRAADVVTTWGERLGYEYPGVPALGERWLTVFPPVDGVRFRPRPELRDAARQELGIPLDAVAVACVGMRNPSKGHEHFVRALALARRELPTLVGRILGGPSAAHAAYERAFTEEARRLGLLDGVALRILDAGKRVAELLPAFDVLTLTSVPRSEGMPTVILEAMASGLPVLATDVGAVDELVVDGETGVVVPALDDARIAAELVRIFGAPGLREHMGRAGRRRFADIFGLDRLAERHVAAYDLATTHATARR